jgi:hypothetical protein
VFRKFERSPAIVPLPAANPPMGYVDILIRSSGEGSASYRYKAIRATATRRPSEAKTP